MHVEVAVSLRPGCAFWLKLDLSSLQRRKPNLFDFLMIVSRTREVIPSIIDFCDFDASTLRTFSHFELAARRMAIKFSVPFNSTF